MTHDESLDLIPLAVLGTLDGGERDRLDAHLDGCESCREAHEAAATAIDALGRSVPQVTPPASLRARVMVVATGAEPDAPATRGASSSGVVPIPAPTPPAPTSSLGWLLPVAAMLVAALAGIAWWSARARVAETEALVAQWQSIAEGALRDRERDQQALAEARRIAAVLGASDLRQVSLSGLPPAADARARAFLSAEGFVFSAEGLPALTEGQTYQLWIVAGSTAFSAGIFDAASSGSARLVGALPTALEPAALAVTVEPSGGVPAPTGPKYLLGTPAN